MFRILIDSDETGGFAQAAWMNKNIGCSLLSWQAYPRFRDGKCYYLVKIKEREIAELFILTFGGKQTYDDGWS